MRADPLRRASPGVSREVERGVQESSPSFNALLNVTLDLATGPKGRSGSVTFPPHLIREIRAIRGLFNRRGDAAVDVVAKRLAGAAEGEIVPRNLVDRKFSNIEPFVIGRELARHHRRRVDDDDW